MNINAGDVKLETEDVECILLVESFFNDAKKTAMWFNTDNPHLGNTTPLRLMWLGRTKRLKQFIENSLDENGGKNGIGS